MEFAEGADAAASMVELGVAAAAGAALEVAREQHQSSNKLLLDKNQPRSDEATAAEERGGFLGKMCGNAASWLDRHPMVLKVLEVVGDLLSVALLFADLGSDVVVMTDLFMSGAWILGSIAAFLLVNLYVAMDKGIHAYVTRRASGNAQMLHLLLGFPLAPLLLDLMLALRPLGVLRGLPEGVDDLLVQYKPTRSLLEVTLESLPQFMLQLYLFVNIAEYGAEADRVPLRTLLVSLTLSAISLLKSWAIAWISSRELEISLVEYLNLLLSLGKGLPLEKLRSGLMKHCNLRGLPLDPLLVRVLATVLRTKEKNLETIDLAGSIVDARADGVRALAAAIAQHPMLNSVRLDGAKLDHLQGMKATRDIDLSGRADAGAPATVALVAALVKLNQDLTRLNMTGIELDEEARQQLQEAAGERVHLLMDQNPREARAETFLKSKPKIGLTAQELRQVTLLDWGQKELTDDDGVMVGENVLPLCFALVSIDFSGNNIGARGAEAIGKAVSVMPSLTSVR